MSITGVELATFDPEKGTQNHGDIMNLCMPKLSNSNLPSATNGYISNLVHSKGLSSTLLWVIVANI
jgi:hypothetical protein